MASPSYRLHENTAASLLHYTAYNKPLPGGGTQQCWTRWASANEEFNIASAGGHRFLIKFDKNFSKKHLVTFSKKEWQTDTEAYLQSLQPGQQGKDAENWQRAQIQLLNNKILKTLGVRSGRADMCVTVNCGHPKKNDPAGSGHSNAGRCQVPGCTCVSFASGYVQGRSDKNKPLHDPYAGQPAQQSSCIVLNWIPLNEFQTAVANSILAVDPNNLLPDSPLVGHNPPLEHLTWTFAGRPGAVRRASGGAIDLDNGTWCQVGARKAAGGPGGVLATWTIVHWEGQG